MKDEIVAFLLGFAVVSFGVVLGAWSRRKRALVNTTWLNVTAIDANAIRTFLQSPEGRELIKIARSIDS